MAKKPHVPIEEDVDIEFEYKLILFWEKWIKPYLKLYIAGIIIIVVAIGGYIYKVSEDKKVLNQASAIVYDIGKLFAEEKYDDAQKLIQQFKDRYSDTDFIKVVLAYENLINKEKNSLNETVPTELKNKLDTDQLRSDTTEFIGYVKYEKEKYTDAENILNQITQDKFNYISAQLLKGFVLRHLGKEQEAKNIFAQINENSKYRYFKIIAEQNM